MPDINNMQLEEFKEYFNKNITDREVEVLDELVNGLKYREIASKLNLSPTTISAHINNLFKKFQCNTRSEIVELLIKNKIYIYKRNDLL